MEQSDNFLFVELRKLGFNRTNERNNIVDDNQRMKIRNFGYLNQGALKGQILFTGSSLMEMFPICEIARSQGSGQSGGHSD